MDIVFSANLRPRPRVRRHKGKFSAHFPAQPRKMRVVASLSYSGQPQQEPKYKPEYKPYKPEYKAEKTSVGRPEENLVGGGGRTSTDKGDCKSEGKIQEKNEGKIEGGGHPSQQYPALSAPLDDSRLVSSDLRLPAPKAVQSKGGAGSLKTRQLGGFGAFGMVNIAANLLPYQHFLNSSQKKDDYSLKKQLRQWLLVLEAKKIPFLSCRMDGQLRLYVPALYSTMAVTEINEYSLEGTRQASFLPSRPWWFGAACLTFCLFVWHLLRFDLLPFFSLPVPPFPSQPTQWPAAFGLDVHRTLVRGEWWRLITALTLHADGRHLLSNLLMGGAFFALLAGRIGFRRSFFLTILGGALGNAVSLFFKASAVVSIGFSTSCFALLGILGSYVFCDTAQVRLRHKEVELLHAPRWFTPLAAGLALLAFLGGAGQPNTDFAAHASGAGVGFVLGGVAWYVEQITLGKREVAKNLATALFLTACGALVLAWRHGLAAFSA